METVSRRSWAEIGEAVVVWTGWGRFPFPRRDKELLMERFGADAADELMAAIRALEDEFYLSDARHVARDLSEMAQLSAAEFKMKHPELPDEAIQAFAWCYTFDYK